MPILINLGAGQHPFPKPWCNIDKQAKWEPDIVADGESLPMFSDNSVDTIVIEHCLEHFNCGAASSLLKECHRILIVGGSLIITVPNLRALCEAWIRHERDLDTQLFLTNIYGAFMGDEADIHRWGFDRDSLLKLLTQVAPWSKVKLFDWRALPHGAGVSKDWWILGCEAIK